ncbi:CHAT domain-containing protein [Floridanema aerugineum]|uniref:CHAT domain-containing protein n=1 Tax=Floridaenema aerugineum BLCC-F46 TaxID=3153654 RepID=A0ABV4X663_9CYAN
MNTLLKEIRGLSKLLLVGLGKKVKGKRRKRIAIVLFTFACILSSEFQLPLTTSDGSTAIAQTQVQTRDVRDADYLLNLGMQQLQAEQPEAALRSTQQALKLYQQLNERQGIAQALGNIGICYLFLGNASQAIDHLQQAFSLARELGDRQTEGNALGTLGQLYLIQREYSKATSHLQQALEIAKVLNNQSMADQVQQLLNAAQEGQKYGASEGTFVMEGNTFNTLLQGVLSAFDFQQPEMIRLMNEGAMLLSQKEYARAIEVLKQYQVIVRQQGENNPVASLGLFNLALAYWGKGEFKQAEATLREMMHIWETWAGWNQSGLQTDQHNIISLNMVRQTMVYEMLQSVLVLRNQPETALEISERGRARATLNLLSQRMLTSTQFAISPPTVANLRNIARTQGATLVEYSIIEYSINPGNAVLLIWVIQPNGMIAFHAVDLSTLPQSLNELVAISRNTLGARNRSQLATITPELTPEGQKRQQAQQRQKLQQLHQLLIEPIAKYLPTNPDQRVIFIPQGELFFVPFPALVDAQGNYLIKKHTILTAPSIEVLELTRQQRKLVRANSSSPIRGDDVLVVGNPVMPKVWNPSKSIQEQLSSLPGAEEEVVTIAKTFATKPLLWEQASESAVVQRMPQARIIHLSTHGLLEYGNPQDSGVRDFPGAIALSPSAKDDGLLTSAEILQMKLKAELVVLSACDTGRGRITGDGVIGLSRSLITAGVPSVIVSLWSVPDAPTADLMSEFYRQWQQNPDKAKALRQAMLITMQNHPNPRDWAAFTLIGESE